MTSLLRIVLAAWLGIAQPFAGFAWAQAGAEQRLASPRITGFDVEPAARPSAGSELFFTLYGSPGGIARVEIGGAGNVLLEEVEPGVYEGSYTIRQRDRVTATSVATVNLRVGNRVATSVLDESLLAGNPPPPRASAAPASSIAIERFEATPTPRSRDGTGDLLFSLNGTPGGLASVRIAGIRGKVVLEEVRRGVYEGAYDLRDGDRIDPNAVVTANLRVGEREVSRVLGRPLAAAGAIEGGTVSQRGNEACRSCGVVEAINPVEVKGEGSYVGKVAGGVVGAILGSQVGAGTGRRAAQIAGAVGGAVAGNEIEKRTRTTTHYEVVVRLANGGTQTISYASQPPFAVGARVRVENGELRAL